MIKNTFEVFEASLAVDDDGIPVVVLSLGGNLGDLNVAGLLGRNVALTVLKKEDSDDD